MINDDDSYEPNQYFTVTVSGTYEDGGNTIEFDDKVIVRIRENDERYLTLSPVSDSAIGSSNPEFVAKEGGTGNENQLTISLNEPLPYDLAIGYTVGDDPYTTASAASDKDFTMDSGTATIDEGNKYVTIDIVIADDKLVEPTEYFTLDFGAAGKANDPGNAKGTFKTVNFQDSKLSSQPLSVSIMDNDTASTGGVVHLRGEGGGGIDGFPSTRKTLTEGKDVTITAEIAGAAPTSDIQIPLKFDYFPSGEATSADHSEPGPITIKAGENSGSVTLTITDDTVDERYRELLVVEIDDGTNFPTNYTKGDRSKYEIIMLDNDRTGAKLQELSPDPAALSEESGKRRATFEIEMDRLPKKDTPAGAPFSGVTVAEGDPTFKLEYSGSAKQATRNDDYMSLVDVPSKDCSTTGNKLTCSVTFTVKDDKLYEGGSGTTENVSIKLKGVNWENSDGIKPTGPNLSLTIEDDDPQPMLSVGDLSAVEGGKLAFKVKRTGAMENRLSVLAATANDGTDGANSAVANSDYRTRSGTLEFAKNDGEQTFEVTTTQDVIDEMDETFLVKLSMAKDTGGEPDPAIADATAVGTITDNDTRGITVSKATLTLDEEDNTATTEAKEHQDTYTVVLDSEPSGGTVTIGVVSAGTKIAEVAPATLTFTASDWDEPQTVTVTAVADGIDNPNDRRAVAITHTVTATGTDYEDATASGVTVTVNDDDGAPTLSINSPSVTEVDSGATATLTFTVQLTPHSGNTVTVAYADAGTGTATSGGTDYETLTSDTLTFAPNETSKSVAVTVTGDDIDEPDETVVVRLSSPDMATLTGGATTLDGTGTINDNDATPTVSVADATAVAEGNVAAPNPANNMTFTVTLSATSGLDVTVPYTLGGTATAGTDYTEPDPRSVTIAAGQTQAMIKIPVAGDEVDEENETITVTLGTPTNATVSTKEGAGAASGTITDDDTRGVSVTPTALTVAEADNAGTADEREDQKTYKVVLTSQPTGAVTVNLKSGDESVARVDTARLVFNAGNWNTERTVIVTGQADVIDNTGDARTTTIAHTVSAAGTDYDSETAEGVTVTVTDDDAAPSGITLTANPDSVTENGGAKTITVTAAVNGATRYALARTVSVSVGGGTAISGTDYTAVESFDITIGAGEDDASNTFTLTPDNDVLSEGNETIDVTGTLSGITITPDEITLTDNDAAPSGITLSVDTNGAEDGTPSTVGEDAGATTVTVTATVNGDTRYVDAKTVAVSVTDGTAASPADYAAVSGFNITIAAGVASQSETFTVTPVDDDLDESNETIDVTGTLSSVTITGATVTFTDNDDPVSFSIADAEATEGGKVEFTVSREGAGDNVVSVKVTTATDSGEGVKAADADDYTAIATAQTVNFAKGVASQTVEVQTTQDDLFEPDETFLANLSAPALGDGDPGTGVSIATGKGTATGTIKNDDTQPSFAVADASATEGDGITFTVTRSGAMDNAVSVKWNTKAATGAGAASATDYTPVTAPTTLSFARGASSRTFTVATTEDVLAEGNETFLVELTGAVGGTIAAAEATGTITDDDAAPTGITLSVDADTATNNVQSSIAEEGGVKTVRVTATINGATRFATAQTVTVTVGKDGDSATEGTDYSNVAAQSIVIPIGAASAYVDFPLTPTSDVLSEGSETISVDGTLTDVTFTNTAITITDDDAAPSAITLMVDADTGTENVQSSIAEEGGVKTVRVTATIDGTTRFATAQTVTVKVGKDGDSATEGTDYAMVGEQSIEIPIGDASAYVEFMLTPTTDVLFEGSETISVDGTLTGVTFANSSITITDDDAAPSAITLSVDTNAGGDGTPTTLGEGAGTTTVRVTATITSATRFATEQTVKVKVGKDGDSATEGTDYALVADQNIKIPAGETSAYVDFSLAPTQDVLDEANETISVDGELAGVTFAPATITINDDDNAPEFITLAVDTNAGGNGTPTSVGEEAGATTVRVTARITSATRFAANQAVTFEVGKSADSATEGEDYTEVGTLTITIDGGDASGYVDFTLTPTSDLLDEPNETISVEGTQANITFTDAAITINDDDAAPSGITLSVDTNGAEDGTPSTVAEDAGATVVTVTATVNGMTRYVDAKTVAVSVADGTAASPADYAAVSGFNITIAAGAASQSGSFTVTPVDDDLDEADETIDVTGTLTDITITPATVTLTDTDDPVSFSIADAEATEGGKVTFTVSRAGAEDNVASVKIATAADSGDGAADADDYTAIAAAQTLNFAAGTTSQTVEVQTTQDDLFEPDETFKAVLSAPALAENDPGTEVSIESGKGTAIGTIKNDDTQPSFAVADASASEGDAITFTVTRSGAMDNVVSVKWNTRSDSGGGANAAFPSDYTPVTTARTLTFAKGERTQTFTVATTEDVLDEDDETFLVELTGAVGATIATAQATGTITDDDAAPSGITLTVAPATVGEEDGETEITVTATVNGATRYVDAKTVTVSVGGGSATSDTDYDAVANFDITIAAGAASHTGTFDLTPTDDDLHEGNETIDVTGTSDALTITKATITLEDDDVQPSFAVADASASEGDAITFTVTRSGAMDNAVSVKWNTKAATGAGAASTNDYTEMTTATKLDFAKGVSRLTFTVATTEDTLNEADETFLIELTEPVGATITDAAATGTINNDDAAPTTLTLAVDADNDTENVQSSLAENGGAKTVKVTATLGGATQFDVDKTLTLIVGDDDDSATEGTDYTNVANITLTISAGDQDVEHTFTLTPTDDAFREASETISFDATLTGVAVTGASITLTSDDAAPSITLTVDADKDTDNVQTSLAEDGGAKTVRVTATLDGTTRLEESADLTLAVGKSSDSAVEGTDYTNVADRTITIGAGVASVTDDFTLTPTNDDLYEGSETISLDGTLTGVAVTDTSLTLTDDDAQPSFAVADASASEGDAITFTVTRSGAMDNVVSVKWNTKAATGAGAASTSDYTPVTTATKLDFAKGVGTQTFTVATTEDTLHEGNETFLVELTEPVGAIIGDAQATGTITDDDAAPSGITLSVDTNGSTSGTPSTVAEDAGATVVTVTATVNGETRYVDARTVVVSVADGTAASPADYAAVNNFNITIAAGAASHTGSFTVTPVDDNLDEANETIDVTGTLSSVTITPATVTLTDNDDPVRFSIADADATEGGKVTFTVSRAGAEDNVASVKVATAADSGEGVKAAGTDDYTGITTAQTLNFAKGVTSQTVEVQTTQDDLFEPDETFKAVLSAPVLGDGDPGTGVSIESGKGTATGTIRNDDTQPSFAIADASASEGDAITFTVTRSGAMDNAVSVKWNTRAASGAGAAATTDYTPVTTATTLTFAKGVGTQTFTVDTTEDTLHEGNETFRVELTGAVGATIATAQAIGTINDDDAAPTALTLSVDADTGTDGTQTTIAEDGGTKTVRVTATLGGSSTFTEAKTVTLEVGADADSATEDTDYTEVTTRSITINAGSSSGYVDFTLTPRDDTLHEGSETISLHGTLTGLMVTDASITLTDDDGAPTALTLSVDADTGTNNVQTSLAENGGAKTVRVTATLGGSSTFTESKTVTLEVGADTDSATEGTDYTEVTTRSITINAGASSGYVEFTLTPIDDTRHETSETISLDGTLDGVTVTDASLSLTDNDAAPTTLTLAVDADNDTQNVQSSLAENGGAKTVKVTATLGGSTQFDEDKTLTLIVGKNTDSATEGTDYTNVADVTLTIPAGDQDVEHTFTLTPTDDAFREDSETISFDATLAGVAVAGASITLTSDDAAPSITLTVDADKDTDNVQTSLAEDGGMKTVRVTATLDGTTRLEAAADLTLAVGKDGDSAVEGTDYTTVADRTITIGAGVASVTDDFTLTPTNDDIDEPDEGISIEGTLAGITVAGTSLTITDDEVMPTVRLVLTPTAIDESGDDNASTVTATLSGKSSVAVTVTVAAAAGADTVASDFTVSNNKTLTIAAGATTSTGSVTITAVDNDVDAPNKTVTVSAVASGGGVANPGNQTLTITDDEGVPTVTLALDPTAINESGNGNASTVMATLSGKSNEAVTLTVAATAGADTIAGDFTLSGTTLTIAAGATTSTGAVTITAVDNDVDAPNKTVTVSATASGGGVANPGNQTLTITDDEGVPTVTLALDPTAINESGNGNASTVMATLSGKSNEAVTLTVAAAAGADTVAADFALSTTTTLTIAAGATTSTGTVTITAVDNDVDAPNKTVTVSATASGGGVANPDNQTLTINDDEGVPTATLVLTPTAIDESGATNSSTVTAMLSGKSNAAVTLTVAAAAGADTASGDFTLSGTTLTIAAGATTSTGTVTITAVDNDVDAPNKTVTVSATASGGGVADPGNQTLTITDDEGVPTVTLVLDPTTINESGATNSSTVTAMLSGKSSAAVTVTVSVPNDAPVTLSNNAILTIAAGATTSTGTVKITAVDNDVDAANASVVVSGVAAGGGVANPDNQTLTINDDEGTPTVTLALTPTAIDESGDDNASTVTAMLSGKSSATVTVTVSVPNDAPVTLSANTTLTIAAGATTSTGAVTITAVDNDVDAPNKTVTVSATASGGGVANPGNQTLTITDDEGTPTATLVLDPTTIDESGDDNASTVTATLSGKSNEAVTLTVAAAAGANTASGDFTLSGTTLTIAAGATTSTGSVTITAVDNDVDAPNKTVTVSATASGGGVADPGNQTLTITDDEGVPTATLVLDPTTIDESGDDNASTVTATLSGKSNEAVTLTVAAAAGADTASGDFTLSGTTLTIAAGATTSTGSVTITAVDNDVDAPNKTVTVSATASGGGVANPANQTLTINDDDDAPSGITLSVSPATVGEEDGETEITVTATVNGTTRYVDAKTVTVSVGGGTAISGTDYDAVANFDITIAAGDASKTGTFDLTPINDVLDEANETINVTGTSGSLTITSTTVTINDDDDAPGAIMISVDADTGTNGTQTTIAENGSAKTVRVTATITDETRFVEAKTVTLEVGVDADSATEGADYANLGTRSITINAGSSSGYVEFTLTPTNDVLHEGNETISLDGTLMGVTVTDATITLTDDDAAPTGITLTVSPATVGEGAGETEITVTATVNGTTRYVDAKTVTVSVGGGTATSDTDYDAVANFDIVIAAGDASKAGTFDLTPTQDDLHEGSETIGLDGTVTGVTVTDATLTLTDDDGQPSFAVADASADEGDAITFTVTRSGAMDNAVSVKWNTKADTGAGAAATTDYTAMTTATKLDFASGASSQTFTVATTEDTLHEGNETFLVELTEPVGGIISDAEATGTITNDDAAPTALTLSVDADTGTMGTQTSLAEDGGVKTVRVTATLGGNSTFNVAKTVAVEIGADADGATEGTDYANLGTQNITINAGASSGYVEFTLTPTDDDIDEPDEGISIEGTLASVTVTGTSLTITDDEGTPTVTLVLTPTTINESGNGNASTVTATLSGESSAAVTVEVSVPNDAPVTLSATTTLTIAAGSKASTGTVTITAVDNDVDAPNASVVVSGVAAGGGVAVANPGNQTLTITDDEGTPTVTLVLTPTTINETGATNSSTVKATLSGKSNTAVTLTVAAAAGTDTAASDFTVSNNKTLTIAAGATTSTGAVTITAVDNDVDAPNKTVTVSATASGGSVADPTDQTLTITDDEGVPTVTLVLTPTTINESGNGNASTVTATLSGKSNAAVTLTVAAAAGADTVAGDFTLSGTTLTIAAGATTSTGAVTITAVDNDVDAPNKTVTVSATASGGGVANPGNQTLTITDDEGVPTVTLALDPTTVNESGNGNASTVTATLSGESSAAVTVEVSVPNNAPVTLSANKTLTIAAGAKASTGTVTITAVDNDVDAANASVVVSGVAAGGSVANPADQTLTITDDEGTPTATLVLAPTTIDESGATNSSTVTATLSGKSNTAVTLTVAAAAGADTVAGDFTVSGNKTLTIAAGARTSTGTVKITAVNNNVDAPDKSVTVSATASGGGVANPDNQILTITDDDAAPSGITLSVSPATLGEGNGLTTITVTATVNGSTRYVDAKTVTVSVGSGTAIAGTDYGAVSNFDITIAAGDASKAGTFDLTPTDDALHEEDETIEVTGSSGALTITPATVTITDNDASGPEGTVSLSASRYEVLEGDSLSVTVKLSESLAADTVIELEATSPSGHTATPGTDYDGAVQTVTIRAGATSGQARISTTRDNRNDPNETFKLAIRASELPGTVTLGEPDTAVVTIRERVSGITPPATATVKYAGRKSRILMPVPAGLKGHGIDVAFYFDWGPGTAQGGGDCREPGTDVVDWGHWPSFPEGMVRTGPLVRIAEDIDTDTIELEIELCEGSVGKTFTATWDTVQWLGNPDRGFPGFKSYPFNAAAAHCTSTALCWTKVTIIGDTPDPDPEVTISAGSDITEGGDAVFTVQATPAPKSDLEVTLAIADDAVSDFLADGEEGSKTVTIAAGSDTATYTLATTDDDLEEANGGVSATLAAGAGYQVGSPATATVAVADNDDDDDTRATIVRITGGAEITEGSVARFTLTGAPAPSQDIIVNLRVTQSGAFSGDGELGARTVTLGADATVTVDIPTVDDSTLEDDGSLTITVEPGTGYTPHATDASATVAVVDNEEPSLPTIHIDDVEAAEGDDLHFTFTLSHAVDHEVDVWWETRFGTNPHDDENGHGPSYGEAIPHADFRYADSRVTVYPGSTRGEFWVETFDDSHDEGRETLTVVLTEATGAIIADELAIGTIVNSDPMPAAWLGRFGRAVAEQALDGIAGRIAAPRTAGMQGMVAGQALSFGGSTGFGAASPHGSLSGTSLSERARLSLSDIDRLFGDERAADRSRTLSGRDLLLSSRFTLTGERDATGGNLAFWGRAAQSGFDGREGRFSLDGEAMTAMLGADYARDRWLAGMALMRSSGKGGGSYADPGSESGAGSGSVRGAGGKVEATLTAAIPYLTLQASERVKLWGALGHGVGEVMLKPELGEMLKSDISWSMASLGLRGDLLPTKESPGSESGSGAGGPALALVSDALWAGTSSEKTRGLAASESNVTRLRLGLEGSWKVPLEGDASITPKLEMGMRHDGGDAETGFGVELGGGITWMDPRLGLSLDFSGRALVAHDAGELENRGFATSLAFDPDPASERGLSFALRQDWGGQAEGGLDALFQADPLSDRTGSGSTSGSRWSAEGAYGFPAFSGRFISSPHMGLGLATGARDSSLGWRLTPARNAPDFSFGLKATRRESDGAGPEHTLGFEISARW